jgi:uncharacterized protein
MKVWIDMTNSPHVPLFKPIIRELEKRGHEVFVTARDYAQTIELLQQANIPFKLVGKHKGGRMIRKIGGLVERSWALSNVARDLKPDVAISHGSNDLAIASFLRRIPHLTMFDYEYIGAHNINFRLATKILRPEVVPIEAIKAYGGKEHKVLGYEGIKEDIYVGDLMPNESFLTDLGVNPNHIIVSLRPPATLAHYQANENSLFEKLLLHLGTKPNVTCIVIPRVKEQADEIKSLKLSNVVIPTTAVDGLNLIYWSDLVISAGGTMNREAAALGVPVFTVYKGTMGAVDLHLMKEGKMQLVESVEDFRNLPLHTKRVKQGTKGSERLASYISNIIESVAGRKHEI